MESAAAFLAADAVQKRAAIAIDDEGDQNKKQKLSDSVVATTTDDGDDDYSTYVCTQNHSPRICNYPVWCY